MPAKFGWAIRVVTRSGSTRLIGPYGSKQEANNNRPGGAQVVSAHVFKLHAAVPPGPPRVLDAKQLPTQGGAPPPPPPPEDVAPVINNWDIWQGNYVANEVVLLGTGFTGTTTVEVYDWQSNVIPGTSFTVEDDNNIVIHWPSGEIIPTSGWRVVNDVDEDTFLTAWALGYSISNDALTLYNPTISADNDNEVRITDENGTGNFVNEWFKVEFFTTNVGYHVYDSNSPYWSTADGGNTIVITDPVLGGDTLNQVQMHQPNGFIVVNSGSNLNLPIPQAAAPGYTITSGYGYSGGKGGRSVAVDSNGRYAMLAEVANGSGGLGVGVWMFQANGQLDTGWGQTDSGFTRIATTQHSDCVGVAFDSNDDVFVAWNDGYTTGSKNIKLTKLLASDGSVDPSWNGGSQKIMQANAYGVVDSFCIESDDRFVLAWQIYPGVSGPGKVYRYDNNGNVANQTSISAGAVRALVQASDGQYMVAVRDSGDGSVRPAHVDLDAPGVTVSSQPMTSSNLSWSWDGFYGIDVSDSGEVCISGTSPGNGSEYVAVGKWDAALNIDTAWGNSGLLALANGGFAVAWLNTAYFNPNGSIFCTGSCIPNTGPIEGIGFYVTPDGTSGNFYEYPVDPTDTETWFWAADWAYPLVAIGGGVANGDPFIARIDTSVSYSLESGWGTP